MDQLDRFSQLVAKIQQAPLQPGMWPRVLKAIASEVGANASVMFSQDAPPSLGGFWASDTYAPEDMENYAAHFSDKNVWLQSIKNTPIFVDGGKAFISDVFIPAQKMQRTEFYNDFLRPLELGRVLGCVLSPQSRKLVPSEIHLSLMRPLGKSVFTDQARKFFELLIPHLQAALKTHYMLSMNQGCLAGYASASGVSGVQLTSAVFEALPYPVLIVNLNGRVLFANESAVRLFRMEDGLFVRQGVLEGVDASSTMSLKKFMMEVRRDLCGDYVHHVRRLAGRSPYVCMGYPLSPQAGVEGVVHADGPGVLMLTIRDPEKKIFPSSERLKNLYDMTETEAAITKALTTGLSIADIANRRNVSENTVRSQVKAIFMKTGCRRQTELLALMHREN